MIALPFTHGMTDQRLVSNAVRAVSGTHHPSGGDAKGLAATHDAGHMNQRRALGGLDLSRRFGDQSAVHHAEATQGRRMLGWTVVLRRQPAQVARHEQEGRHTHRFELICCECGDDPGLDYWAAAPEFQRLRGPYPITAGIAAYREHVGDSPAGRPHLPIGGGLNGQEGQAGTARRG
jgi:hypothetical protein